MTPTLTFLNAVQARTARISASSSATRKQGGGVVGPAREFLSRLPLTSFATDDAAAFVALLDKTTHDLASKFPAGTQGWGLARKLLNIFLRDSLYTTYLSNAYGLTKSESMLEVPLDSISAAHIYNVGTRQRLPRWPGVKYNTASVSEAYQGIATEIAAKHGIARVHLDTFWWGERESDALG